MKYINNGLVSIAIVSLVMITFLIVPVQSDARYRLIKAKSEITIVPDKDRFENLSLNEETTTNLTITYIYGRLSIPSGFFLGSPSPTQINLTIVSKPSWCDVELEKSKLSANIPLISVLGGNVTLNTKLSIMVTSKDAPGYKIGKIVIGAKALDNGNINSSEAKCEIYVSPGFYPDVEVNKSYVAVQMAPGEKKDIPLEITNNGNMEIIASIDVKDKLPDLVDVDTSGVKYIDIQPGKSKDVSIGIEVKSYDKKINERYSIPLEISYYAGKHNNLRGEPLNLEMSLKIKGEPKSIFATLSLSSIEAILIALLIIVLIIVIVRCRYY